MESTDNPCFYLHFQELIPAKLRSSKAAQFLWIYVDGSYLKKHRKDAAFINWQKELSDLSVYMDELQALDKIYLNNDKERQLITALFNFFVAMTKQSHLAHIIIASSDGYFLNTVFNDSKLKKCSEFYKVDYLPKEDAVEWLLNLEKYSKIKDYTLSQEDAEKIWEVVGGSMWEIQHILSKLFEHPIDEVLADYK